MRTVIGGMLVLGALACGASAGPQALLDTDKSSMRAAVDSFTAFVLMHRDSAAAWEFTENASFMPPNHAPVRGRADIRKFIKEYPPLTHFTASAIEIEGRGDLAYIRGTYQLTFEAAVGKTEATDFGKFLEILRRQSDGRWLVTADIFNSDMATK
jgi:ketosteroid isomerase-like protein